MKGQQPTSVPRVPLFNFVNVLAHQQGERDHVLVVTPHHFGVDAESQGRAENFNVGGCAGLRVLRVRQPSLKRRYLAVCWKKSASMSPTIFVTKGMGFDLK